MSVDNVAEWQDTQLMLTSTPLASPEIDGKDRAVRLRLQRLPGYASHVVLLDATTGQRICRTPEFRTDEAALQAGRDVAAKRGWRVAVDNFRRAS